MSNSQTFQVKMVDMNSYSNWLLGNGMGKNVAIGKHKIRKKESQVIQVKRGSIFSGKLETIKQNFSLKLRT